MLSSENLSSPERIEQAIAAEGTPALVISREAIQQKYEQFCRELGGVKIYYALKANPHPGIVELLQKLGCSFEISSLGELELLLRLGVSTQSIISSNPVKDQSFIKAAHASGIDLFAFDSQAEVEKLSRFAPGGKVYVRLSVSNEGSEWPLSRKFGVDVKESVELLVQAKKEGLESCGVAFHVGSQCTRAATWVEAIEKSRLVWDRVRSEGIELRLLNIGGGFPIQYIKPVPSIAEVAAAIRGALAKAFPEDINVIAAPGRALVGGAGTLAATVIAKAFRDGQRWLYLDIGVFGGLMESIGGIEYPLATARRGNNPGKWVLAGPSCDSVDVISREAELPELEVGDRVYIMSAGAYTTAYASEFDGFPVPKTFLV